ncbi:MAG: ZIP family metal transporter [Candidatus Woesearchaeota archaeon]|nr:ZIP family metal transporter [Candidatus Woesearchaeota archaeon]
MVWFYTILSVVIVSLISLIGIFTLVIKKESLSKILFILVSFSAGALLGDSFIHLIPEISETTGFGFNAAISLLAGIMVFFILEKFIQWRHCHVPTSKSHPHPFAYMNLIGDGLHNSIDGMVIAASYIVSVPLGIATTLAVIFHEIPQEIGDFGVLLHGGFSRAKALFFNLLSALTAVIGAVVILIIGTKVQGITDFLLPFTAGGFIYIAGSDLIPEMHKENKVGKSLLQLAGLVAGMAIMAALIMLE